MQALIDKLQAGWADLAMLQTVAVLLALALAAVLLLAVLRGRAMRRLGREIDNARQVQAEARAGFDRDSHAAALRETEIRARLEAQADRLGLMADERDELRDALHLAREAGETLRRDLGAAETRAENDREAAARELALLRELREEMTGQFRLMADESLRRQGADLEKAHGERLAALLTPFREQVQRFETELAQRSKSTDEERAALREQIEGLHRRSEEIGRDAVALTRALKGEKQRQGAWGEMILERVLESSGLERGTHYDTQASFRDEDGRQWRPDVIVRLPQGKVLVIDSKVSLVDYERAVNADDPADRESALRRNVTAIRTHIQTLSGKGYHAVDAAAVDYVLMFIPIEGAFSEAMRVDPELAGFALDRRVGLTTPTTLMLTLRTVDHIWTVERRETNAVEIAQRAGALYDKVAGFVDAIEGVGKALTDAQRAHGQAMDRLTRGQGNVIRQVEMLRTLGARTTKKLALDHDADDSTGDSTGDAPAQLGAAE